LLAKHSKGMDEPHHDEINLIRLLRRLENSVSNREEWQPSSRPQPEIWLKTQNALQVSFDYLSLLFLNEYSYSVLYTLQKLKFARKLVKNVEFDNRDQSPCVLFGRVPGYSLAKTPSHLSKRIKQLNDTKIRLDRIEVFLKDCEKVRYKVSLVVAY
jgi:hypothetical protein